jgi:type IVB pilus formation R64 PilN family outer membrane protein
MKKLMRNLTVLASSALVASGCTSAMKKTEAQADADIKQAETIFTNAQIKKPDSLVSMTHQVYLTGNSFKIEHVQKLPAAFKQNISYTASSQESTKETLTQIASITKQKLKISDDAVMVLSKLPVNSDGVKSYNGSLSDVLTQLLRKENLYWQYDKGQISIFQVETRIYALDAPTSTFSINNSISSNANSGSSDAQGAGSTNGSSAMNMNYGVKADSAWDAAVATIKNMLSKDGHLDVNPVEGYVTVTDNPERQRTIAEYISKINAKTGKKIAIRVDVYDVQNSTNASFGLNINAIINAMGDAYTFNTLPAVLPNNVTQGNTFSFTQKGDSNPSSIFTALNTLGKTTQVTGTTVYTISGQPAPVQNSTQTNYLKSVTSSVSNGTVTASAETGSVNTGYSMMITPRIQSDNQMLVNLNLQISTLTGINNVSLCPPSSSNNNNLLKDDNNSSNCQTLQLPVVHTKNFLESMVLKSGQSILIAGFQDGDTDVNTSSPFSTGAWMLGGSKSTSQTKTTTVVVVTPYLIGE